MIREVCILIGFSVLLLVCADARTRCTYIIHNADSLFLEFYGISIYDTIYLRFCQYIVYWKIWFTICCNSFDSRRFGWQRRGCKDCFIECNVQNFFDLSSNSALLMLSHNVMFNEVFIVDLIHSMASKISKFLGFLLG